MVRNDDIIWCSAFVQTWRPWSLFMPGSYSRYWKMGFFYLLERPQNLSQEMMLAVKTDAGSSVYIMIYYYYYYYYIYIYISIWWGNPPICFSISWWTLGQAAQPAQFARPSTTTQGMPSARFTWSPTSPRLLVRSRCVEERRCVA